MRCAEQLLTICYTETSKASHFIFLIKKPTLDQTSFETTFLYYIQTQVTQFERIFNKHFSKCNPLIKNKNIK